MRFGANVAAVIPAFNEESSIGKVISAIPHWVDDVIVVDNGSTDKTSDVAAEHGATVPLGTPSRLRFGMSERYCRS